MGQRAAACRNRSPSLGWFLIFRMHSGEGKVLIEKTGPGSRSVEEKKKFLAAGKLSQPEPSRLKGRMTFAEGQLFGRAHFESTTFTGGVCAVLVNDQGQVVQWFSQMLEEEKCRQFAQADAEQIVTELEAVGVRGSNQPMESSAQLKAHGLLLGQ